VVQLTSLGEREKNIDTIARAVRRILGDVEVFVPAFIQKVREESHTMVYMDGYVFVRFAEGVNYLKLQETTYFKCVLCTPGAGGKRTYHLLDNFVLDKMRDGVKSLKTQTADYDISQDVRITKGTLKGLRGKVISVYEDGKKILVHVPLDSKPVLIEFPPTHLEKAEAS
jgi:transcription antitermination factor NusG